MDCTRMSTFDKTLRFIQLMLSVLVTVVEINSASEILRPRGVSITKASLYVPERDFTCFDGSATIPFIYVNDDYCDCNDGSDEPGTPACPNGTFHCTNAGHRPLNIPSSRVNDGICDCCDTSDEYATSAPCINNCYELGKVARAEAQKLAELTKQGSELRVQLSKKGKQIQQEKQEKLSQLEKDLGEAERLMAEQEGFKSFAEELEKIALKKYQQEEEEKKQTQQEDSKNENEQEAFEYFHKLDSNQDGKLQLAEIQTRQTFENRDRAISDEEAKFFLDHREEMTWEDYIKIGWPRMKPLLMLDKGIFQAPDSGLPEKEESGEVVKENPESQSDDQEDFDQNEEEGEEEEEEEEEEDDDKSYESHPEELDSNTYGEEEEEAETETGDGGKEGEVEKISPQYDEETQKFINEANQARSKYEEAETNVRDIKREIQQIKDSLQKDYGPEEEFAPLDGECFEYTDNEYVYRLCPFDQATQRSKSGGADTRLGLWRGWVGEEENKYQTMLFDGGQSCWNGPQRSTKVKLSCGVENVLTSVSEPNRCEYVFEFVSPSVCQPAENVDVHHDEL